MYSPVQLIVSLLSEEEFLYMTIAIMLKI